MTKRRSRNSIKSWFLAPFSNRGEGHEPDKVLLVVVMILVFLGLVFLSSASSTLGFYRYNDSYFFLKQQLLHGVLPGFVAFYFMARINYWHLEKFGAIFLLLSLILLGLVHFSNLGNEYGTARSWINLGGVSFQPSEFVKLFYILYLASWLDRHGKDIKTFTKGFLPFVIVLGIISFLIIAQPDIGTLSIIAVLALAMYFAAGANLFHIGALTAAAVGGFWIMVKAAPYRLNRVLAWLDPNADPQGIGWQVRQSLIAIGSGGWFGLGLGSSRQKSYLPQPANDSIFAVIAEEVGFVFTMIFLLLFIIVLVRGFRIARQSEDNYAKFITIGITTWVSLQIFVNIAGLIQLLPLTGVPLTFVSLGGSNMIVSMAAMGIMLNISRFTRTGYVRK